MEKVRIVHIYHALGALHVFLNITEKNIKISPFSPKNKLRLDVSN